MDIEKFRDSLVDHLTCIVSDEYQIDKMNVVKTNGVNRYGITFKNDSSSVSPVIYVDEFYKMYKLGNTVEELAVDFLSYVEEIPIAESNCVANDVQNITSWDSVKNLVRMQIVNTERNKNILDGFVHKDFLNLSIIFYVKMDNSEYTSASVKITHNLFSMYNVKFEDFFEQALKNEEHDRKICSICDMFDDLSDCGIEDCSKDNNEMMILTNTEKFYGASEIVSENNRKLLVNMVGGDCYVIPSSVHEMIIIPKNSGDNDGELTPTDILKTVVETNSYCVSDEEYLADAVYMISKDDYSLKIVAGK